MEFYFQKEFLCKTKPAAYTLLTDKFSGPKLNSWIEV